MRISTFGGMVGDGGGGALAAAAAAFPPIRKGSTQPGDFEHVTPRLLRHVESGVEYRIDGSDPLGLQNPRASAVEAFYVEAGRLVFLRPRHSPDTSVHIGSVHPVALP